jgi:hypothetical protein
MMELYFVVRVGSLRSHAIVLVVFDQFCCKISSNSVKMGAGMSIVSRADFAMFDWNGIIQQHVGLFYIAIVVLQVFARNAPFVAFLFLYLMKLTNSKAESSISIVLPAQFVHDPSSTINANSMVN